MIHFSRKFISAKNYALSTMLVILAVLTGCSQTGNERMRATTNAPFTPDISINEVMVAQIDHAAHFIWDTANPDLDSLNRPWDEVEHHAIQLISSRAAMTMGGTGVNDAMWIAQPSWRSYVDSMNDASLMALASARSRDLRMLSRAGDLLVESCEGCHQQYKPNIPTEGYLKSH